jgi:DNA primase
MLSNYDGIDRSGLTEYIEEQEIPVAYPPWELAGRKFAEAIPTLDEVDFDSLFDPAYRKRDAVAYFRKRGISRDFMRRFDLRWDAYRKRVLFKVKRDGKLYGASGRSIRVNPSQRIRIYNHKKSKFLLGEEHLSDDFTKPLVVIEGLMGLGELDSLGLYEYADAVCLQGSILSKEQRDRLVALDRHIVLMFDNDAAGHKGLYGKEQYIGAIKMLEGLCSFHVFDWPNSASDFLDLTGRKLRRLVTKPALF